MTALAEPPRGNQRLVLALHAALIAAVAAAAFELTSTTAAAATIAALVLLPLVAVTLPLFRGSLFHCRLTTVLLVPYFCVATMELVANPDARALWAVVAGLTVAELAALVGLIRRLQHRSHEGQS